MYYETKQTQTFYAHIGGVLKLAEQNCPIEILKNIEKLQCYFMM